MSAEGFSSMPFISSGGSLCSLSGIIFPPTAAGMPLTGAARAAGAVALTRTSVLPGLLHRMKKIHSEKSAQSSV